MTLVSDNFQRADGSLGGAWGTVNSCTDNSSANPGPYSGGIILKSHAWAPSTTGTDAALCAYTGQSFGNDQFASGQISAIAAYTSQVAITACSASAGTSTYTYTLSSGSALIVNQVLTITGMTNSGNNSPVGGFRITGLGAGTFAVLNGSPGANESGSSGTGISASDSICGVAVRVSADGKTGYMIQVGTNSGNAAAGGVPIDHRTYCVELWKMSNSVGTSLALYQSGQLTSSFDSVGDIYTLSVFGTTLSVIKYAAGSGTPTVLLQATDSAIASGSPGIGTWTLAGAGEWSNPPDYTTGVGNSGTQWTNFVGGDGVTAAGSPLIYSDDFQRANAGNLGANWTIAPTDSAIQTSSFFALPTALTTLCSEYYSAATLPADQYAETTIHAFPISSCFLQPAVRQSAAADTRYYFQIQGPIGSTAQFALFKRIAGVQTQIGSTLTNQTLAANDKLKCSARGTTITAYKNGVSVISGTDSSIASGSAGFVEYVISSTSNCQVSLWTGSAVIGTIAGSVGATGAGALISWTGNSPGMVVADGSGNYTIPVPTGAYVITPILAGYTFAPGSSSQTLGATDITGVNFTTSAATGAVGNAGSLSLRRRKRRDVIS